ncbi:hypothetical protein I7I50_08352 [Histoplasma capsulatum G186AR]|uniref:Uncharacterized protein n=1 Tax=Ajellomyces capsulatus TaxID=5037 RepID=A0A8H8CZ73_AJECA|nr:hypothetical protein I7I52_05868 [Histoplasma capsulatum]QSS73546.1 hypothetical protein I7I50_08352 [Histoplasma capsulatum G186AR]
MMHTGEGGWGVRISEPGCPAALKPRQTDKTKTHRSLCSIFKTNKGIFGHNTCCPETRRRREKKIQQNR